MQSRPMMKNDRPEIKVQGSTVVLPRAAKSVAYRYSASRGGRYWITYGTAEEIATELRLSGYAVELA